MLSILVLLNNYLHDLAAAVLIASMILLFVLVREVERQGEEAKALFVKVYRKFSLVSLASLIIIILGGIVRTITYRQYEWAWAAGRGQVTVLIAKHIILFTLVGVGIYLWIRLAGKVKRFS